MVDLTLTIVVLNQKEEFLQFLDPDLCLLKETCTANGLRTLEVEYKFQDMKEDKLLFKIGNKIWVQGDNNLTDCLYIINTEVKEDIFKENSFTFDCEEVLVELTYAPIHSHTDITSANGFKLKTENGAQMVRVDFNALNFWFGEFFNIGVVQDCISTYASYISVTGTITPMALLRQIEEETGNIFITRYEKDCLNNTIHRYLDFLNPINVSKNWLLNLEYKFVDTEDIVYIYDSDGELTNDVDPWVDKPYSSDIPSESLIEELGTAENNYGEDDYSSYTETEYAETWNADEQNVEDPEMEKDYTPRSNLNPDDVVMRITKDGKLLDADGNPYDSTGDVQALQWTSEDLGFEDNTQTAVITLDSYNGALGIAVNTKTFLVAPQDTTDYNIGYVEAIKNDTLNPVFIEVDDEPVTVTVPDDAYFEFYDTSANRPIFRTCINREIGHTHDEVLDLGFNLENVVHDIDETDTYTAVQPILSLSDGNDSSTDMTRTDLGNLIERWESLKISKGDTVPMIVQKISVKGPSLEIVKRVLGSYTANSGANQSNSYSNWWIRPYHPKDNIDTNNSNNSTWEFLRGTSYWNAPYTKGAGHRFVETDKTYLTEYAKIHRRNDRRLDEGTITSPKSGTTESTDEDIFQIYNQVALYLKEHEEPNIDLELDVANLRGQEFNNYNIWDKVYIKIPDTNELITARVTETSKEAHDVAKNTIKVSNYKTKTVKTITKKTVIHANNVSFKYPATKKHTITLENVDYIADPEDPNYDPQDIQYPALKLINLTLYKVENGSSTFIKNYTKKTNVYGQVSWNMKYDPGDYKFEISFGGDEEFAECSATCKVNVSGVKEVKTATTNRKTTNNKTTAKTSVRYKTVKTYWTKCGLSPDKNHARIISIAQPSAGDGNYSYNQLWETQFKNYCPECHHKGTLRFDGGKANKCISSSTYGVPYKPSVPEHEITCIHCDSDFDGVTGLEKDSGHSTRLTRLTTPKKSSRARFAKLTKGQLVYGTKKIKVTTRNVTNTKNRKIVGKLSKTIKNKALSIVGNKTGYKALRAIVDFMDNKIVYSRYEDFLRSPETVLSKGAGNCCDQTRLFLQLCDGAGLTEYYKLYYRHVTNHVYAIVESKKTGNKVYVDCASDAHTAWAYVCLDYRSASVLHVTRYPTLPF